MQPTYAMYTFYAYKGELIKTEKNSLALWSCPILLVYLGRGKVEKTSSKNRGDILVFHFRVLKLVVLVRILYQFSHTRYESVYRRCSRCNRGRLVPLPTNFLTLELSLPLFRFSYFWRAGRLRRFCLENTPVDSLEAPLVDGNLSGCWRIDKDCRRMCWWRAPLLIILETSRLTRRLDVCSASTLLCHFNCRFINASCLRIISLRDAFLFISKSFSSRSRFSWQFVFLSIAFLTWMLNPRSLFGFLMFRGKQTLV